MAVEIRALLALVEIESNYSNQGQKDFLYSLLFPNKYLEEPAQPILALQNFSTEIDFHLEQF